MTEIGDELGRRRLLTLTGAGGSGKTTLALEAATRLRERYPGGAYWVELAPLADDAAVPRALVLALGVQPRPDQSELDAAAAYLAARRALVVLDNCEHLLDGSAEAARSLLEAAPECTVLATSRAPLGIAAEAEWRVPPLSLPPEGGRRAGTESEAVALFAERAREVDSGFALTPENDGAVAEICTRLDGMPLAIELAAARIRMLSPPEIAAGLDDALALASRKTRSAESRQRTLRASIAWSHELLDHRQQRLLRRLGVFAGGCTLELAEEVCADEGADDFLDLLGALVEHSLVGVEEVDAASRYSLLETVRQFAVEQLEQAGETRALRDRHLDAVLAFAERQRELVLGPRQPEVLAALEREAANLLAALDHAIATDGERALRLADALAFWLRHSGRLREGSRAVEAALEAADPAPSPLRARGLASLALIAQNTGDFPRAWELASGAFAMADELGADGAAGYALGVMCELVVFTDTPNARHTLERGVEFGREAGNDWLLARALMELATLDWFQQTHRPGENRLAAHWELIEGVGDRETASYANFVTGSACYATLEHDLARERFDRAIAFAREIRHPVAADAPRGMTVALDVAAGRAEEALRNALAIRDRLLTGGGVYYLSWIELMIALAEAGLDRLDDAARRLEAVVGGAFGAPAPPLVWAQAVLGEVSRLVGDRETAHAHATAAREAALALGNRWNGVQAELVLGRLAAERGDLTRAEELHHSALAVVLEDGLYLELASAMEGLARVAAGLAGHAEAARILGCASRVRRERGPVPWPAQLAELDELTASVRAAIPDEFDAEHARGEALSEAEAVAWIRRARGKRKRPPGGWESLTPTELEVARHAAAGLTNPQIGERMFISRATVKTHLSHIYAKLGITNRVELASEVERRADPRA